MGLQFVFFFFQAEVGIRDLYVTGVQTCALPIFGEPKVVGHHPADLRGQPIDPSPKLGPQQVLGSGQTGGRGPDHTTISSAGVPFAWPPATLVISWGRNL